MADPAYNWKRFWCPRTGTIKLTDGGYLQVPYSDVLPFESIASTQCLILLGEPGIGKSIAMQTERQSIDSQVAQTGGKTLWLDLREFGNEDRLIRELFENEEFTTWESGTHQLHVFLDALDEALLRIDQISAILVTKLQKYPVKRLYLRIACRTADWPNDLEQGVYGIWGKDSVKIYELAPLRWQDVIEAAQVNGLDPEAFLKEIDRVKVVPLAIKPVTLELLINTYRRHGNLPKTQAGLYLEGCRLLCEVPSRNQSRSAQSRYILTADQRLATAARIAAITIFARRAAIWTDIDRGDVPEDDVTIRDLLGGKEQSNSTKFELTELGVWQTLGTGLFSARGPNRLGWSHQTYAEFLAARYLRQSDLTLPQMMSLIVHPHDPEKKIVPQLHETAAWLATMVPEVFREIVKSDP